MWKTVDMKHRLGMLVASVSLLGSLAGLPLARADTPAALCTLQIAADGNVLGTLTDHSGGLNLTVFVPPAEDIHVPIQCNSRKTLALVLANHANNHAVTVHIETLTNQGQLSCTKAPLSLPVNSGSVVTFGDCP